MAKWELKQQLVKLFDSSSNIEEQNRLAAQCFSENVKRFECFELIPFLEIINTNRVPSQKDSLAIMLTAFDLMLKYATNLLSPKRPPRWRTILTNNSNFKARIDCMNGARDILKLMGYCEETSASMKFPDNVLEPDRPKVALIAAELLIAKVGMELMIREQVDWSSTQDSVVQGLPSYAVQGSIPQGLSSYTVVGSTSQGLPSYAVQGSTPQGLSSYAVQESTSQGLPSYAVRGSTSQGLPSYAVQGSTSQGLPSYAVQGSTPQGLLSYAVQGSTSQGLPPYVVRGSTSQGLPSYAVQGSTPPGLPSYAVQGSTPQGLPSYAVQGSTPRTLQKPFSPAQEESVSTTAEQNSKNSLTPIDEGRCSSFGPSTINPITAPSGNAQLGFEVRYGNQYPDLQMPMPLVSSLTPSTGPSLHLPRNERLSSAPIPKPRRNTSFISTVSRENISLTSGDTPQLEQQKVVPSVPGIKVSPSHLDGHIKRLSEIRAQRELIKNSRSNHSVSCQFPVGGGSPSSFAGTKENASSLSENSQIASVLPLASSASANVTTAEQLNSSSNHNNQPVPKPRPRTTLLPDTVNSSPLGPSYNSGRPQDERNYIPMPQAVVSRETIPGESTPGKHPKQKSNEEVRLGGQVAEPRVTEGSIGDTGYKHVEKASVPSYKDFLSGALNEKKLAKQEWKKNKMKAGVEMKAEPVISYDLVNEEKMQIIRKGLEEEGSAMLQSLMRLIPKGLSPDEVALIVRECKTQQTSQTQMLTTWHKKVGTLQTWVNVYDPKCMVGMPSVAESKQYLLKLGGALDEAAKMCYQDRKDKIMSLINKMKPYMEVKWEVAKVVLCDYDMEVEKAAWALQRDILGPLYEFINSEQEWAKVKQSDMSEIKHLLRGGGWADKKAPLRLLIGECKFEDTERANIVLQLMDYWEKGDGENDYELQFYIDAAKDHRTLEDARKYLSVECPICMELFMIHKMVLMPGCPHSVCKECFKAHFTEVMKTKTVKHFNCPVCSEPDMADLQSEMYLLLLMQQIKAHTDMEIYNLFEQKLIDYNLSKEANFCWCANNCRTGFINDTGRNKIKCPTCKEEMCFKCKKPWEKQHDGLTCDEFAQWKHDNDPELQQQGLAAHLEANGIECPACHYRYDLARGGCMHFKCTQCPNEFCSGCGQAFKQNCKKLKSCAGRGLHAHHPRDCLFYLRDFSVQELQGFLEKNNIPFDKEPPKAQQENNENQEEKKPLKCSVTLQKETADGLKDDPCGTEATAQCAGLCEVHYKEYLVSKLNKAHLDPISLYNVNQLQAMLLRDDKEVPQKEEDEDDKEFMKRLVEYIEEEIPLQHM